MFEIDEQTELQTGHFQVVDHLAAFFISDAFDSFRIDNDLPKADQVRDVRSNNLGLKNNVEWLLLLARNCAKLELNHESILIDLFVKTMSDLVQNFHRTANDYDALLLGKGYLPLVMYREWVKSFEPRMDANERE